MATRIIDNAKSGDVREVLAFVLRTYFLDKVVSWMELREKLEYTLEHWPDQPPGRAGGARKAATTLIRDLQKTFVAGRAARAVAVGPETPLARFAGSSMSPRPPFTVRMSDPEGQWWFDARWLEHTRGAIERLDARGLFYPDRTASVRDTLRERLAVRHDWNTMSRLWRLHLAPGTSVVALVGRTRRQPTWSRELVLLYEADQYLPGGLEQYYVPHLDPASCSVTRMV